MSFEVLAKGLKHYGCHLNPFNSALLEATLGIKKLTTSEKDGKNEVKVNTNLWFFDIHFYGRDVMQNDPDEYINFFDSLLQPNNLEQFTSFGDNLNQLRRNNYN
jgi:hypothetical protein